MGGGKTTHTYADKISGIQLQSSSYNKPIPLVYGSNKLTGNCIYYNDFTVTSHTESQGGKGGGGGKSKSTTYTYHAAMMFGICEGPAQINRVWKDKDAAKALDYDKFTVFPGNASQTPWSYLTSKHPSDALGYAGTLIVANSRLYLPNASPSNYQFEIFGRCQAPNIPNAVVFPDCYPDEVIVDILSGERTNLIPVDRIGNLVNYRKYCIANGFYLSPKIEDKTPAKDALAEILEATNSNVIWSSDGSKMVLKVVPYGDVVVTGKDNDGTEITYTPDVTPLYDLENDDFLPLSEDGSSIEVTRANKNECYNIVPIEYVDIAKDYNTNVISEPETLDVQKFGERQASDVSLHCIHRQSIAQKISKIKAQRYIYCKNQYKFKLPFNYILLEPMDIVTLTESNYGLDKKPVRILEIEENDDATFTFVAEEWPFGVAHAASYDTQVGDGYVPDTSMDPGNANAPTFFTPPIVLTGGTREIWFGVSGGENWGGAEVWISVDGGTSYSYIENVEQPAKHGTLLSALPASTSNTIDNVNSLDIQLEDTRLIMQSVQAQERDDLYTLCYVDGELLSYQNAELIGPGQYRLTGLKRGVYDTSASSHEAGTKFLRCGTDLDESSIFKYPVPPSRQSQIIAVKLRSFNVFGGGLQELEDCAAYYCSLDGVAKFGLGITNLIEKYENNQIQLQWDKIDFDGVQYEIRLGPTWRSSQVLGRTLIPKYTTLVDGTYHIASYYGNAYSDSVSITISGCANIHNVVQEWDETTWTNITDDKLKAQYGSLYLNYAGKMSDIVKMSDVTIMKAIKGYYTDAIYEVPESHIVDLGTTQISKVSASYRYTTSSLTESWAKIPSFKKCPSVSGVDITGCINITLQIAIAKDDGVFGDWQNFIPGEYAARKYKMRMVINTTNSNVTPVITEFKWTIDMPDRVEKGTNVTIPASAHNITYTKAYQQTPNVVAIINSPSTGDYSIISNQSKTGFTIELFNSTGTRISKNCNWQAVGF